MRRITLDSCIHHFVLEHIYREFNADADALANEALDASPAQRQPDGSAVSENWNDTVLSGGLYRSLYCSGLDGLDELCRYETKFRSSSCDHCVL